MKIIAAILMLATIYYIQNYLFRKNWFKNLDLNMGFSRDYIECGERADLVEVITNDKFLPLPSFNLKFSVDKSLLFDNTHNSSVTDYYHKNEVFSVMGHQRVTRKLSFMGTKRGVYSVQSANYIVHDYFMVKLYAGKMRNTDAIYVFPKKITTDSFRLMFKGLVGELETRRNIIEDSMSFRGIREYQPFDPYRSINWKQSAKAGELMVNMRGFTTDSRVHIMLNLDSDNMIETDKLLEEAISLTSSFARQFIKEAVNVSVITNAVDASNNPLPVIGEGAELKHGITIDRMLTEIKGSQGKDSFIKLLNDEINSFSRDNLYLIISPYAKDDLIQFLDIIEKKGGAVRLIVPYYDEYPFVKNRSYADGWEVPINV
ncbi:Protein of unknown function DUF58 [Lachnospiraceae bacterium]|nr:Protein of unknown function DUF58 [Lachnospiraceae bacterium]